MKYPLSVYLNYNPFISIDKDDTDIRVYEWKMVKTRIEHECCMGEFIFGKGYHIIPKGEFAMREHAIVEGAWESTYSCMDCMDKWLTEEVQPDETENIKGK